MKDLPTLKVDPTEQANADLAINKENCKGRVFRGKAEQFVSSRDGSYSYLQRMVPLKRKSCKGCQFCDYLDEYLSESICNGTPPIMDQIIHNKMYYLAITNESRDWETGIVDDFDLEFLEYLE